MWGITTIGWDETIRPPRCRCRYYIIWTSGLGIYGLIILQASVIQLVYNVIVVDIYISGSHN